MTKPIFTADEISRHVDRVEAQGGNSANIGAEMEPGQKPSITFDAQGERVINKDVDLTWGAWAKTKLSKATTAVGAKIGFKW